MARRHGPAALLCFSQPLFFRGVFEPPRPKRWPTWEIALVTGLFLVALLSRVWSLTKFPDNIYPDEIMTGTVATQAYLGPARPPPPLFRTVWSGIDLPALWFWIAAVFLKLGGNSLAMLRLPAALFGAAAVLPIYGLIRGTWGRYAATAGTAIMAFSVSNVHYSRLALNNITTQFFWATCFLFLLRGLRSRRRSDWAVAGLSAGVSEYFYYGTRLLPFILLAFVVFVSLFIGGKHEIRKRFARNGRRLFRRVRSAVGSLFPEPESLSGERSKPSDMVACSK